MMLQILTGDALERLRELTAESVQCCVTSPPYWGLRDYGTAEWEGGEAGCDHRKAHDMSTSGLEGGKTTTLHNHYHRDQCPCGARRIDSQLGLEKTPEEYVAKMVAVFREVRRVLRKDGTLWLNLGDSYAGGGNYRGVNENTLSDKQRSNRASHGLNQRCGIVDIPSGLKPKDLCGIPWRVAFALQADGWWLRSDIIWAKPNPMPESVTDRPTKSHEYLFLLTKSANYFYDAEAIKEKSIHAGEVVFNNNGKNSEMGEYGATREGFLRPDGVTVAANRNKRSVWTVATAPYPEAHFATYPPDLVKPCIMAGTKCGDVVLDPFAGSGTTGAVALELGRKAVLIELNPAYVALIEQRCTTTMGLPLA